MAPRPPAPERPGLHRPAHRSKACAPAPASRSTSSSTPTAASRSCTSPSSASRPPGRRRSAHTPAAVLRTLRLRDNAGSPDRRAASCCSKTSPRSSPAKAPTPTRCCSSTTRRTPPPSTPPHGRHLRRRAPPGRPATSSSRRATPRRSACSPTDVPGLRIGYDPCHEGAIERLTATRAWPAFVAEALAASPSAELVYLAHELVLFAAADGFDLVAAFHRAGRRIDAYTHPPRRCRRRRRRPPPARSRRRPDHHRRPRRPRRRARLARRFPVDAHTDWLVWYVGSRMERADVAGGQGREDQAARRRDGGDPRPRATPRPRSTTSAGRRASPRAPSSTTSAPRRTWGSPPRRTSAPWPPRSSPPPPTRRCPTPGRASSATSTSAARSCRASSPTTPACSAPWCRRPTPPIPAIRAACEREIVGHAATLEADIAAALAAAGRTADWTPASLALHIQAVLQGAFVLAKATGGAQVAADSLGHLRRYLTFLFESDTQGGNSHELRRRIRRGGPDRQPRGLPQARGGRAGHLQGVRRAALRRVLGRRRARGQGHLVPDGGAAQGRRDGGLLLGRVAVEGGPRHRLGEDDGRPADAAGREPDAVRRQADDLRRLPARSSTPEAPKMQPGGRQSCPRT